MFYLFHSPDVGPPLLTPNNGRSLFWPPPPFVHAPVHTFVHQQSQQEDVVIFWLFSLNSQLLELLITLPFLIYLKVSVIESQ